MVFTRLPNCAQDWQLPQRLLSTPDVDMHPRSRCSPGVPQPQVMICIPHSSQMKLFTPGGGVCPGMPQVMIPTPGVNMPLVCCYLPQICPPGNDTYPRYAPRVLLSTPPPWLCCTSTTSSLGLRHTDRYVAWEQ